MHAKTNGNMLYFYTFAKNLVIAVDHQ